MFGNNKGTTTDIDGRYSINPGQGKTEITFRLIGYKSSVRSVEISSNDTLELNVGLDMDFMEIGQIVVSANRTGTKNCRAHSFNGCPEII